MTFKHTKFEDSAIMRSFEKLSLDKGIVKNDLLKKIAERQSKLDLSPSSNLVENVIKLCVGLRENGFNKYAEELESAFMLYKQAEASECDNDILEQAHPKGSYKLNGVAGDAVVETIIDQHLANMKIVNKMPTGKLTTASEIINAVKTLTKNAQDEGDLESNMIVLRQNMANKEIKKITPIINNSARIITQNFTGTSLQSQFDRNFIQITRTLKSINENTATVDKFTSILTDLNDILNSLSMWERVKHIVDPTSIDPSVYWKQITHGYSAILGQNDGATRDKIINLIRQAKQIALRARSFAKGELDGEIQRLLDDSNTIRKNKEKEYPKEFNNKCDNIIQQFTEIKNKLKDHENVLTWATNQIANLNKLKSLYNPDFHNQYMADLNKKESLISKFKITWSL